MTQYQPYVDYTAQSSNHGALLSLLSLYKECKGMDVMPIVVFLAFAIESYVNSIGAKKISCWDEIERIPWKSKIELLYSFAGQKADWSSASLGFAKDVFQIRDKLAHGKPAKVLGEKHASEELAQQELALIQIGPTWRRKFTPEWIEKSYRKFRILTKELSGLYNIHESDVMMISSGGILVVD